MRDICHILCLVLWTLTLVSPGLAAKLSVADVGSDGGVSNVDIVDNTKAAVFINNYKDQVIHLWWEGDDGSVVKMGRLNKGSSAELNTFVDHVFFATFDPEANRRANPAQVNNTSLSRKSFFYSKYSQFFVPYLVCCEC